MKIEGRDRQMEFMFAGKSHFTVVNEQTGGRFTFRVTKPKETRDGKEVHFVACNSGTGGEADESYAFMGTVFGRKEYRISKKTLVPEDAPAARAWKWVFGRLMAGELPGFVTFYHEGRCGRCGRRLTTPESISLGIGPECLGKIGKRNGGDPNAEWAEHKAAFARREAEQEQAASEAKMRNR